MMNSSSFCLSRRVTSGVEITNYFMHQSPNALDTDINPLTRPITIPPPAYFILSYSYLSVALWSWVKRSATPFVHNTERESPTLIIVKLFLLTIHMHAVQPTYI